MSNVFHIHVFPRDVVSDLPVLEGFCTLLGTSPPVILLNLMAKLSCLMSQNPTKTLQCSATGVSPFQCAYGYQPLLFPDLEMEVSIPFAQALFCR